MEGGTTLAAYWFGLYLCIMPWVFSWCAVRVCVAACGLDWPPFRWLKMGNLLLNGWSRPSDDDAFDVVGCYAGFTLCFLPRRWFEC